MASKKRTAGHSMLAPDPIYDSLLVTKFINCLMWQGKKSIAQKMFYDAMEQIKKLGKMGVCTCRGRVAGVDVVRDVRPG